MLQTLVQAADPFFAAEVSKDFICPCMAEQHNIFLLHTLVRYCLAAPTCWSPVRAKHLPFSRFPPRKRRRSNVGQGAEV